MKPWRPAQSREAQFLKRMARAQRQFERLTLIREDVDLEAGQA